MPSLRLAVPSALLLLVASALLSTAAPLEPRQGMLSPTPYVGTPWGDWYRSTNVVQCEPVSITFGGGDGAPYSLAVVSPPPSPNASVQEVQVLERVGVLGMPGATYLSIDGSSLEVGTPVALQIIDRAGTVAYSMSRHVAEGHLNEFCHYPGAFWPPSHWDGNHFVIMLLVVIAIAIGFWLGGERFKDFVVDQRQKRAARRTARLTGGIALSNRGDRSRDAESAHVLGDAGDDDDEDHPLLDPETGRPPLPPAYEDAVKPEEDSSSPTAAAVTSEPDTAAAAARRSP